MENTLFPTDHDKHVWDAVRLMTRYLLAKRRRILKKKNAPTFGERGALI